MWFMNHYLNQEKKTNQKPSPEFSERELNQKENVNQFLLHRNKLQPK